MSGVTHRLKIIAAAGAVGGLLLGCNGEQQSVSVQAPPQAAQAAPARELTAALSHEYAKVRKAQVERVDYQLSVQLDRESEIFNGTVVVDFDMAPGNTAPLTLDYDSGEVVAVKVNGQPAEFAYDKWFISLAPELFKDGQNTVEVTYKREYATDGSGLHRFVDPETSEIYLYTDFEPYDANRLFPHFDQPNLKARYTVDVVAPAKWQVVSTTRENRIVDSEDGVSRHWHFPQSAKISSYVFALHAGPYHIWEDTAGDIPLRLFARQSMAKYIKTEDWFKPTQQSFGFFNEYFGVTYPFGKYDQLIVPDFNSGAMENVAAVTFSERYVSRGDKTRAQRLRLANVIAHEMAHMWFGDLVTMDWWNGLWLNESFATYMANLEVAEASDFENTWDDFYARTKQWAYRTDQQVTTHPIELAVGTTSDAFTNFDGITYGKGASVLKQLPYYLGEENFRQGVSNYLKKFSYKNTELDDFIGELGKAAGKNLDNWQQQWLYQAGLNSIELNFQCEGDKVTAMNLLQSAPAEWPTLREQRVQVGLYQFAGGKMQLDKLIPITYSGATTEVTEAKGAACPALVYPNVDDWGYVKVNFDGASLKTLKAHINDFEKPGMRLMLWQNLWDGVRDAQVSLADYTRFAVENIAGETDRTVLRQVLGALRSADGYLATLADTATAKDAARYTALRDEIERLQWAQAQQAEAGSDLQKIWFDGFAAAVHTEAGLAVLPELLDGKLALAGFDIDQDRRWQLVLKLNQHLQGDYAKRLAAEQDRDGSDLGQKMAIASEVVRPEPAVKSKWLDIILANGDASTTSESTYNLSTLRYAMGAMFPADQQSLMRPFSERLLEAVPALNESADLGYLRAYARALTPAACDAASVARLAKAKQAFDSLNPTVAKAYKISHQEDQRCVDIGELLASE